MQAMIYMYAGGSFYSTCSDPPPFPVLRAVPFLFSLEIKVHFFLTLSSDRNYI